MQEPQPSSMTPPPFDWTRYQPPGPTSTFGGSPPPTPPPSSPGGGDRPRHPAHRARIAAAVLAGTAFGGLLGATAFSRTSDATTAQPSDDDTASSGVTRDTTDGEPDDTYGGLDDLGGADPYGDLQGDRFGGSSVQRPEPPSWGGSAQAGGESTVPGDDDSSAGGSAGPTLRSQGS